MPYQIENRPDGGVVCEYRGVVSPKDNESSRAEYTGGNPKNLAKIPYLLSDHTNTKKALHSVEDMRRLGETLNSLFWAHNEKLLIALVVPSDAFFGLARVLHAYARHKDKLGLFRSRAEAEAWIAEKLSK